MTLEIDESLKCQNKNPEQIFCRYEYMKEAKQKDSLSLTLAALLRQKCTF